MPRTKFQVCNGECLAIEGLLEQTKKFVKDVKCNHVFNAGLIAEIQRIEHFEICAYGTAVCYANELGFYRIANLLKETLEEEYSDNDKLGLLAQMFLNYKAISG